MIRRRLTARASFALGVMIAGVVGASREAWSGVADNLAQTSETDEDMCASIRIRQGTPIRGCSRGKECPYKDGVVDCRWY